MAENQEEPSDTQNGEEQPENAEKPEEKKKELEKLPPFEIVRGERFPAFFFKFQFRNVEYSSGRNKTFLCYVVEIQGKEPGSFRGYLEDEHAAAHAEDAFFNNILPTCDPNLRYNVTWYVSSSPCAPCADRIAQVLQKNKNLRLSILSRKKERQRPSSPGRTSKRTSCITKRSYQRFCTDTHDRPACKRSVTQWRERHDKLGHLGHAFSFSELL
ncbi:unnamed protein product [Caretta caretta]